MVKFLQYGLCCFLLLSCSSSTNARGVLRLGLSGNLGAAFTPMHLRTAADTYVMKAIYQPLLQQTAAANYQPLLAASWHLDADGRRVSLTLRPDVRWHDGQPFSAADVAFTMHFIAAPGFYPRAPDYYSSGYTLVDRLLGAADYRQGKAAKIAGIVVDGPLNITLIYSKPNPDALYQLSRLPLIAQHLWQDIEPATSFSDQKAAELFAHPVGTGAFRFVSYQRDGELVLAANRDYWRGPIKIAKLVIRSLSDNIAQALLLRGELDIFAGANWEPEIIERLAAREVRLVSHDRFAIRYIGVNHRHPILGQQQLRQALLMAIDRKKIVEQLCYGRAQVVNTAVLKYDSAALLTYDYNPQRAIAILQQLGWQWRDGYLWQNNQRLRFTLKIGGNIAIYRKIAPVLVQQFADIGVELKVLSLDFATMLQQITNNNFELFLLGTDVGSNPAYGEQLFTTNTGSSFTNGYQNDEVDELYRRAAVEIDDEQRQRLYRQIAQLLNDDLPFLWLFKLQASYAISQQFSGFSLDGYRGLMHDFIFWEKNDYN